MVKIRVSGPWDTPENIKTRLLSQFLTENIDLTNVEFVTDDTYDVVVFFNYIDLDVPVGKKIFIFPHEPTWSGSHQKNFNGNENLSILGFNPKFYTPADKCIPTIAHTFYGGRGPWVDKLEDWNYTTVCSTLPIKTKTISSIVTNLNSDTYVEEGCSYKPRYDLTKFLIEKAPFIDFYGGWGLKDSPLKKDTVENYMFTLGIENQFTDNWITEKFYDSILYNSIPIYYGCTNIKEYYPENGYILIEDPFDRERTLKQIQEIQKNAVDIYSELLPGLLEIKKRYFDQYNLLKKIISISTYGI